MYETCKENAWTWFLLLSLTLFTGGLLYNLEDRPITEVEDDFNIPTYTLKDFTTLRMDEQGQLKSHLSAKSLVHYRQKDTKLLVPTIVFYREGQRSWVIRAERGEMSADGNQIRLLGHTVLERESVKPRERMTITTQDVHMQRDKQYAETAALTTISINNTKTYSLGVRVFISTKQVELVSKVRGEYSIMR